ncbi:uncharacterized protein BJ212DRAFT_1479231 [Suillus subaureus]|uniref:Uncharacterized protein n=1 Tax=Suillus subaureus TaxID=48587 RepID=A0A9P7JF54_9AGAM|nr:uncharacterized protein BJ212DRAFT_1479231 [Suillus subaureus]KAG1819121.1 hypothetical protein BJ212DRAFT_1479231 [Suillus subaureus]
MAITPPPDAASPQELHQISLPRSNCFISTYNCLWKALAIAQKLLLNMCSWCRELLKKNALLEASASQGQKKLAANELALVVKQDVIKAHGCKYSMACCLWIDTNLFPLHMCPNINLSSKECWLSPLAIEDSVKAKLFLFIPQTDHELMNHKNFGSSQITAQGNPTDTWEEDFECALEDGVEAPVFSASTPPVLPRSLPPNKPPPQVSIDNTEMDSDAVAAAQSRPSGFISTAMQELVILDLDAQDQVVEHNTIEITDMTTKPKPKPKPRRGKGKTALDGDLELTAGLSGSNVWKSSWKK